MGEFECSGNTTECCQWQKCLPEASGLYRGKICPDAVVPDSDPRFTDSELSVGAAKFSVGFSAINAASAQLDYPRNSRLLAAAGTAVTGCPSLSVGCMGPGCSKPR